jgi:dipeptidyl aminopeptidase/acylaminoacyl peptidase
MNKKRTKPGPLVSFGSWESPITAELVAQASVRISDIKTHGHDVYWIETRPEENGRNALVVRSPDAQSKDALPAKYSVRTRVHEYGGAPYAISNHEIFFTNFSDQRLYRASGSKVKALSAEVPLRYADLVVDGSRNRLICVVEDHMNPQDVRNFIGAVPFNGHSETLVSGNDFYSNPRLSPDGTRLCWLTWNHPNMPWDGCELWVGDFDEVGQVTNQCLVAGGKEESIAQPEWSSEGELYFVSDRTGWWNIYRLRGDSLQAPFGNTHEEFARPQWVFGLSSYAFANTTQIVAATCKNGRWGLSLFDLAAGTRKALPVGSYTSMGQWVCALDGDVVLDVASPTNATAVAAYSLAKHEFVPLNTGSPFDIDPKYMSVPEAITFPSPGKTTSHAWFYPPNNPEQVGAVTGLPPAIVHAHGGPTSAAKTSLSWEIQYWTSRGFAYVDVDYAGSSGYGRAYRNRLRGTWGIADVKDCIAAAKYLAKEWLIDDKHTFIDGGSAGGFTTLCALTFHDYFSAGASYYGVGDLEALARDTHKFESHYLDSLVGPYPAEKWVYELRSPINSVAHLKTPLLLLQGADDQVVPVAQAQMMFDAVKSKGIPCALLVFPSEQHGFRRAENIATALTAEHAFYAKVLGIPGPPMPEQA